MTTRAPTDFGRDTSCMASLRTGKLVTGLQLVAEAAYRRLTTPAGTLRGGADEENYGLDLSGGIGDSEPRQFAAALPARIRAELLKDERIIEVTVVTSVEVNGPATSVLVDVRCETRVGPFRLKLAISDVTVSLLGIEGT
jgi:hypothetical protein